MVKKPVLAEQLESKELGDQLFSNCSELYVTQSPFTEAKRELELESSNDEEAEDRDDFPSNIVNEECNLQEDAAELPESFVESREEVKVVCSLSKLLELVGDKCRFCSRSCTVAQSHIR
ncbi:uncharacterized protein [Dysidea avara]|uniref:uncharacterized protein isoform X5 n=1 Tax=Dysidea avara TaxID=196820 RepID=UPI0033251259